MKNTFNIFKKAAAVIAVALGLSSCLEVGKLIVTRIYPIVAF